MYLFNPMLLTNCEKILTTLRMETGGSKEISQPIPRSMFYSGREDPDYRKPTDLSHGLCHGSNGVRTVRFRDSEETDGLDISAYHGPRCPSSEVW